MRTTLALVVFSILAAAAPCVARAGKTDTIKSADFPGGGFRVGDTISATFTMTGNGAGTYTQNQSLSKVPMSGASAR